MRSTISYHSANRDLMLYHNKMYALIYKYSYIRNVPSTEARPRLPLAGLSQPERQSVEAGVCIVVEWVAKYVFSYVYDRGVFVWVLCVMCDVWSDVCVILLHALL